MPVLRQLLLALCLWAAPSAWLAAVPVAAVAQETKAPDYAEWEEVALTAEETLENDRASNRALEQLRARLVEWRATFTAAQGINAAQLDTVRNQIAALGPAPTEAAPDAPDIAQRRRELNDRLSQLQAPGLAAVEAHSRADGLIRQIDTRIRARQATEFLRLSPSPLNPANWPAGWAVLQQGMKTLGSEVTDSWSNPARRAELKNNALAIILYLLIAAVLVTRGSGFMERMTTRLQTGPSIRAKHVAASIVSLGQVVVPVLGTLFLVLAVRASGMAGTRSLALIEALPSAAFLLFTARWIASWLFRAEGVYAPLAERAAEARFHINLIALVSAAETFRRAFITEVRPPLSMAAQAVWAAPLVFVVAILLFRLGLLLRPRPADGAMDFRNTILRLVGTATVGVSLIAPVLAAIGYVAAANGLIWPTVLSLGLLGLILILQRFAADIYLVAAKKGDEAREALIPVLIGFGLTLLSMPLFALVWGARTADLSEAWTRFSEGISLGGTRLSPGVLLTLVVIFAIGYAITRLVQSALRSAILPRTQLEKGVQNAVVSGVGYLGLFLAALIGIIGAGIDLSSLAIVAGALSVGIGFGLQNIVQNFVSGIILLIERPISEGDMIEVNGQFGTVRGISVRSTWIETFDRTDVIVPNADLISGVVTNLTRTNLTGRLIIPVGVAYGTDTRRVQEILMEIAEAQPLIMVDPAPSVPFVALGSDSLDFEIRAILSDVNFKVNVQSEILHQIVERFAAEGIEIPFAQRDIWVRNADELTGRRKAPEEKAPPPAAPDRPAADLSGVHNDPSDEDDE